MTKTIHFIQNEEQQIMTELEPNMAQNSNSQIHENSVSANN